jgi:phage gp37-like protein
MGGYPDTISLTFDYIIAKVVRLDKLPTQITNNSMIYSKTSETKKATRKNDQASKFQDQVDNMILLTAKKKSTIDRKVTAHKKRIDKVANTQAELKRLGITAQSDYSECFEDFKVNVMPINEALLAGLVDDLLARHLAKCINEKQEKAVIEYHKMNQEDTLITIENLKEFYENQGYSFEVKENKPKRKSGTRTRKNKGVPVKA